MTDKKKPSGFRFFMNSEKGKSKVVRLSFSKVQFFGHKTTDLPADILTGGDVRTLEDSGIREMKESKNIKPTSGLAAPPPSGSTESKGDGKETAEDTKPE